MSKTKKNGKKMMSGKKMMNDVFPTLEVNANNDANASFEISDQRQF